MAQTEEKFKCEICEDFYTMTRKYAEYRSAGKTAKGRFLCMPCTKSENVKNFAKAGTVFLKGRSTDEILKHASIGGKASAKSEKPNSSKFSTERWNAMSKEDQERQVKKANKALWDKLKSDENLAAEHFRKVRKGKTIGWVSKGQKEIFEYFKDAGFKEEVHVGCMTVDICNEDLKIAIEFNGDYWHCNPRTWKPDQYNSSIKMTAEEKWNSDRKRLFVLRSMGYSTIVVWEGEWHINSQKYIERICDEIDRKKKNCAATML